MFIGLQNDGTHARLTNPSQLAAVLGVFLILFATFPAAAQTAEERLNLAVQQDEKERAEAMKRLDKKLDATLAEIINQAVQEKDEATETLARAMLEGGKDSREFTTSRRVAAESFAPKAKAAVEMMSNDLMQRFIFDESGTITSRMRVEAFEPKFAFVQFKGTNPPTLSVRVLELNEADQLNGITWKGFIRASFSSYRVSKPAGEDGPPIWDEWKPFDEESSNSFFYEIIEKKGQLQIQSRIINLSSLNVYGDSAEKKMLPDTLDDSTDEQE